MVYDKLIRSLLIFILLISLLALACDLPSGVDIPVLQRPTPTPSPTPPPPSELLIFRIPAPLYTVSLEPGETIAGSRIQYVGRTGDVYQVRIDGQDANKRIADSLFWRGVVAPGALAKYDLRLGTELLGGLVAAGSFEVSILNAEPVLLDNAFQPTGDLHYSGMPVSYQVRVGEMIPGTTMVYEGLRTQGAELSGRAGHPYVAAGDSLVYTGQLRENIAVRYNVRVLSLDATILRLDGTAELWLETSP